MLPDLFQDVVHSTVQVGERKWFSFPLSVLAHTGLIVALLLLAMTAGVVLPEPPAMFGFVAELPAAPPAPPPPPSMVAKAPETPSTAAGANAAPVQAPAEIRPETGLERTIEPGVPGGVDGGIPGGVPGGIVGGLPEAPPPVVAPPPRAPVRVGGLVRPPTRIKYVAPEYPEIALRARIEGVVVIEAVVGADGKVKEARVLRSLQFLDEVALKAVMQWEYTSTLLDGVPTPVILVVTANFRLGVAGASR